MAATPVESPEIRSPQSRTPRLWAALFAAFFAIYVVWGSTFLAIRVLVAEVPPLLAAGLRFGTAGLILYGIARMRGEAAPSLREWRSLALLAALMFLMTYSALFWAEKTVPSGIAAVLVATLPIWTLLLETLVLRRAPLKWTTVLAIVVGFAGVAILTWNPGHYPVLACLAILGGELGWATGAVLQGSVQLPKSRAVTAGAEMLLGGLMLMICSLAAGELRTISHFSPHALFALLYLIAFGSLFAFTAFVWLLGRMPATAVSSHAYVNPIVALALGHWLAGEMFNTRMLAGGLLILASVIVIVRYRHGKR